MANLHGIQRAEPQTIVSEPATVEQLSARATLSSIPVRIVPAKPGANGKLLNSSGASGQNAQSAPPLTPQQINEIMRQRAANRPPVPVQSVGMARAPLSDDAGTGDPRIITVTAKCIVFGDESNIYHLTLAAILDCTFLVDIKEAAEPNAPLAPNAIFFATPPQETLDIMLQRGYQNIYVPKTAQRHSTLARKQIAGVKLPGGSTTKMHATIGTIADHRSVKKWALPDLPVAAVPGMPAIVLADLLCLEIVDGYQSPLRQTTIYSTDFFSEMDLLSADVTAPINRKIRLSTIVNSFRGTQVIEDMIRIGGGRRFCRESQATAFIASAPISSDCIVCPHSLLTTELQIAARTVAKFLVSYDKSRIYIMKLSDDNTSPDAMARLMKSLNADSYDADTGECEWTAERMITLLG